MRSHLGRHAALSTIFEVASEWCANEFIALLTWVEGASLHDFIGVFPLLAEEHGDVSGETLALRWLQNMCQALDILHRNGLVHGDVSPRNMIVSDRDLVLTDYDCVSKIGQAVAAPGTFLYCPPWQAGRHAAAADDIYALAASFYHVVFDRKPFELDGGAAKEHGLNLEGVDDRKFPVLIKFLQKSTDPRSETRFKSAAGALQWLMQFSRETGIVIAVEDEQRSENQVAWLHSLLQAYLGSRQGNQETRGLDTEFSEQTYVSTDLEEALYDDILARRTRLAILCGNASDGKTALLQHLAERLRLRKSTSAQRILEGYGRRYTTRS